MQKYTLYTMSQISKLSYTRTLWYWGGIPGINVSFENDIGATDFLGSVFTDGSRNWGRFIFGWCETTFMRLGGCSSGFGKWVFTDFVPIAACEKNKHMWQQCLWNDDSWGETNVPHRWTASSRVHTGRKCFLVMTSFAYAPTDLAWIGRTVSESPSPSIALISAVCFIRKWRLSADKQPYWRWQKQHRWYRSVWRILLREKHDCKWRLKCWQ